VAILITGGIYHTETSDYVADLSNRSYGSGRGASLVGSVRRAGFRHAGWTPCVRSD